MRSALLQWDLHDGAIEIGMNKVRLDDLSIPKVSILPDYKETIRQHKLVAKTVSIINPRIGLNISDDFKNVSINPNFEKGENDKTFLEPSAIFDSIKSLFGNDVVIKIINADVSVLENGVNWKFKNVYCAYKIGEKFPETLSCTTSIPEQKYTSNIKITKTNTKNRSTYDIVIESINPSNINAAFAKRNIPLDSRIFTVLDGHNLPVSGTLKLDFEGTKFISGKFDLIGAAGSIKLPLRSALSINLGKKIDNGEISGSFSENNAQIDSISISYGNARLHLTGVTIPLEEFKLSNTLNICGTLSLTDIDVEEMETILPENISKSAITVFKNYLPGFRLEFFKTDLKGTVMLDDVITGGGLGVGHSIFKIKDAKIPIGDYMATHVDAIGVISNDGIDVRLTNAIFKNTKINSGSFFISNKDDSWVGNVNATVPLGSIFSYAHDISRKLASIPFEKMHLKDDANLDMKLVRIKDNLQMNDLPFKIVEGNCLIKSDNDKKELRFFWNDEKLLMNGNIITDKNRINLKMNESLRDHTGNSEFIFVSNSDFLDALIPSFSGICKGDYTLKINSSWKDKSEEHDIDLNLTGATMTVPMIGDVKLKKEEGRFLAHVLANGENFEFSEVALDTKNNKIKGKMSFDREGHLRKCSFDEFKINGSLAKVNVLRNKDNLLCSIIGDRLDVGRIFSNFDKIDKDATISTYINLKEMIISNIHKIKNIKGSIDIKYGKIIGGTCYGVVGNDTTLALAARGIDGTTDTLLTLSGSNAGEILKYLKITNTVDGGKISFSVKSSRDTSQLVSGTFEISDFIVKNNSQLLKLISLSSPNWLASSDNFSIGFNSCSGNFTIAHPQIVLKDVRVVGPTIVVSFDGTYDRIMDNLSISGMVVPINTFLNSQNSTEILVADFTLNGYLGELALSVQPLKYVPNAVVGETFGNLAPDILLSARAVESISNNVVPLAAPSSDPFSQSAFDKKPDPRKRRTDEKHGVKITRGIKPA
jgi:hypothetical protein